MTFVNKSSSLTSSTLPPHFFPRGLGATLRAAKRLVLGRFVPSHNFTE